MSGVKRWGLVAGLVALALAPAACAATQTDATSGKAAPSGSATHPGNQTASGSPMPSGTAGSPMPSGTGNVSSQDAQFLQAAHQSNLAEIASSKLAQQKNVNQQVKDLAGRFVTDHTKLDQSLRQTASKVGVTLPGAPSNDQQNLINQMQGLNGRDFETRWVTTQLVWHAAAMQLGQSELAQGSDAQVQRLAQDAAPILQAHHDALLALARKLGIAIPSGSPATPGVTPSPTGTAGTPSPTGTAGTPSPSETGGSPSSTSTEETPSESQTE